jgi:hypothetical protein
LRARAVCSLVALLGCVGCASGAAVAPRNTQAVLLKKWALARCLAKAGGDSPAGDDAAKSAAAYLEMGTAGIEVYEKLEALVGSYLAREYTGSVKNSYNTMKCFDLFESGDLDKVARDSASETPR